MIKRWLRKYLSIVYVLASLLGVLHHHDDLKQHQDCQICTIQSTLSHSDTPCDTNYLSEILRISEATQGAFFSPTFVDVHISLQARSPPFSS